MYVRFGLRIVAVLFLVASGAARAATSLEHGQYLVESIAGCGNCHTPQGPDGPLPGKTLAGNVIVEDGPAFRAVAPNITQDGVTGIGFWSNTQIMTAIREGIRPDGSLIGPPMPIERYRGMADDDVAAIAEYLRTVPAISNVAEKSTYRMILPARYGPPVGMIEAPPVEDIVATGAYLAGPIGHCIECHSPLEPRGRDFSHIGAGGQLFSGPWGHSVAANITSDKGSGLGSWTDDEIERAIRTGVSRDGHALKPPMGYAYYARISPGDMAALIAYLRTIPPPTP